MNRIGSVSGSKRPRTPIKTATTEAQLYASSNGRPWGLENECGGEGGGLLTWKILWRAAFVGQMGLEVSIKGVSLWVGNPTADSQDRRGRC